MKRVEVETALKKGKVVFWKNLLYKVIDKDTIKDMVNNKEININDVEDDKFFYVN